MAEVLQFPTARAEHGGERWVRIALVDDESAGFLAILEVEGEQGSIVWGGLDYRQAVEVGRAKAKALGVHFVDFTNAPTTDGPGAAA